MTLSREARIILAIVFVAVAAWLWINYFTQAGDQAAVSPAPVAPPAPVAVAPPTVARELTIAQLPFLVTTAPEAAAEVVALAEEALVARPERDQRAINPFSPIIVRTAPEPAAPTPAVVDTAPPQIEVVDLPLPVAPSIPTPQPPRVVSAPAPQPLAPPPPVADNLPRALPGGTLPIVPGILRQVRATPADAANLAEVAALRVPETVAEVPPRLEEAAPIGAAPVPLYVTGTAAQAAAPPLSAGINPLARYLRDQNVTFTGSVLGPIGVGVFRSSLTLAPVVIVLGQPLPDTDIVLTGLRGQEAILSQGDYSETLALSFRR